MNGASVTHGTIIKDPIFAFSESQKKGEENQAKEQ